MSFRTPAKENIYKADWSRAPFPSHLAPIRNVGVIADSKGTPTPCNIYYLDQDSLRRFLRSRGGNNELAEDLVCRLLGHELKAQTETNP
jgi:hypothetical protein